MKFSLDAETGVYAVHLSFSFSHLYIFGILNVGTATGVSMLIVPKKHIPFLIQHPIKHEAILSLNFLEGKCETKQPASNPARHQAWCFCAMGCVAEGCLRRFTLASDRTPPDSLLE